MNQPENILIVDDEPNIILTLDFALKKKGYETMIARDGDEALELLNKNKIDLILLDIMMPKVDGLEVVKHIKSSDNLKNTKIILLSAKSKPKDVELGFSLGVDDYVTKPFSMKNLMERIKEIISNKP